MPRPLRQRQMDGRRIGGTQAAGRVRDAPTGISPHLPAAPLFPYTFIKPDENSFVMY